MRHGVDLRCRGWHLCEGAQPCNDDVTLIDATTARLSQWRALMQHKALRRRTLVVGVGDGGARARLLALGFGDVLDGRETLGEVEARAARVAGMADALPRMLRHGALRLDLLAREAFLERGGKDRALGLFPREFALLWRLMETPGRAVAKDDLLREVWRLSFVPDTNSLAVHASRLRAKLAQIGLAGWVEAAPAGGYVFAAAPGAVVRRISRPPAASSPADYSRR
jgi:DNA-binding response OmpR family regulator